MLRVCVYDRRRHHQRRNRHHQIIAPKSVSCGHGPLHICVAGGAITVTRKNRVCTYTPTCVHQTYLFRTHCFMRTRACEP